MSECEQYIELISAMADGEASSEEEALVREHVKTCESCRAFLDICALTSDALENDLVTPPEELLSRVMSGLPQTQEKKKAKKPLLRYLPIAACLVLVIGAAAVIMPRVGMKKASYDSTMAATMMYDEFAESLAQAESSRASVYGSKSESGRGLPEGYRVVITAYGQIPDAVAGCTFEDEDGLLSCIIDKETAEILIKQGYEAAVFDNQPDEYLLVVVE